MRFEIQQQQRAQHLRIAHRRRQLQAAQVQIARDEPQAQVQHGRAAIAVLEALAERIEQPREHERERLEVRDGPLQFERRLEGLFLERGHERPRVFAARQALPADAVLPQPLREIGGRQRGQFAQRAQAPAGEDSETVGTRDSGLGSLGTRDGLPGVGILASAFCASGFWLLASASSCASTASVRSGSGASAAASSPSATTVTPARAAASSMAAVQVPATATCTGAIPRSAAAWRRRSPMALRIADQALEAFDVDHDLMPAARGHARRHHPRSIEQHAHVRRSSPADDEAPRLADGGGT